MRYTTIYRVGGGGNAYGAAYWSIACEVAGQTRPLFSLFRCINCTTIYIRQWQLNSRSNTELACLLPRPALSSSSSLLLLLLLPRCWHAIVAFRPLKVIVLLANMHQMGNITTLHGFFRGRRNLVAIGSTSSSSSSSSSTSSSQVEGASANRLAANWGRHRRSISITLRRRRRHLIPPGMDGVSAWHRRLLIGNTFGLSKRRSWVQRRPTAKLLFLSLYSCLSCLSYVSQTNRVTDS